MATIRSTIQVTDAMSPALRSMNRALSIVISSFEELQRESGTAVNLQSLQAARRELSQAEQSFREVDQQIEEAAQSQQRFNNQIQNGRNAASDLGSMVRRVGLALGGAFGAKKLMETSDQYTGIQARLRLINDGQQSVARLNDEIFLSADRARGKYAEMSDIISKLGITASQAFSDNKEMIQFTELMTKSFKVAGASAQEQKAAMYQLTQAMASGRLQGDEYRSILENAPMLAQAIAKEMDVTLGGLKELSSEGLITSNVIKAALFNSAEEINQQFATIPLTFADIGNKAANQFSQKMQPTLASISTWLNTERGTSAIEGITSGVAAIVSGLGTALTMGLAFSSFMTDNWSAIGPLIQIAAGALIAYNGVMITYNLLTAAAATAKGIMAAATAYQTGLTIAQTVAQTSLNAALLANPFTWIVMLIGAVIAAMIYWVKANGGLEISFMKVSNVAQTMWAGMVNGVYWAGDKIQNGMGHISYGIKAAFTGIGTFFSNFRSGTLMMLQDLVNGSIDLINQLIEKVNRIAGVSFDSVSKVTFGTKVAIEEEAKRKAMSEELANYGAQLERERLSRSRAHQMRIDSAAADAAFRQNQIESKLLSKETAGGQRNMIEGLLTNIDSNTAAIRDSAEISEEDLRYMRDIAEQEVINKFTTAQIQVEMKNDFGDIRETADVDGVLMQLEDKLIETMHVVAEGVNEDV